MNNGEIVFLFRIIVLIWLPVMLVLLVQYNSYSIYDISYLVFLQLSQSADAVHAIRGDDINQKKKGGGRVWGGGRYPLPSPFPSLPPVATSQFVSCWAIEGAFCKMEDGQHLILYM